MDEKIPPTKLALSEALSLSAEILRNIEMSEMPLENIALKTGRLARLLNDFEMQKIIEYEVSGYPVLVNNVPPNIYRLAVNAGREYELEDDSKSSEQPGFKSVQKYIYGISIRRIEESLRIGEVALASAIDRDVAISSSNPYQSVWAPTGNALERQKIKNEIENNVSRLASRRSFIYHYVLNKNFELKFSGIADDIFTRIRGRVDSIIGATLPESVKRFNAVYDNLQSENPEDWSNAVHSCRRILQDLADAVFPPTETPRKKSGKEIKLGTDNYINRIIAFVEDSSNSKRYQHIVGSQLKFLGERLDSIFEAAQKGSHTDILKRAEADRYVAYTYLLVGDILMLLQGE